eukprot:TRINITY_DN41_c0_g1_i2.p1 TRINITY_DN41_c0_g1~~TRINITY_DN41_c0_g1_i2.p1  ORF type:complete len:255 (-),score=65.47 TRINITY_DN41_c0_g1_i2:88-852(-)
MGVYPTEYIPTTFDSYHAVYNFEQSDISLGLWDTAGQAEFERLRPISYKNSDIYLVFFSVVNPTSLENVSMWVDEIQAHAPDVPFFLVGTQTDQRENPEILADLEGRGKSAITPRQGKSAAKSVGAVSYLECSAMNMQFDDVFDTIIRYVINVRRMGKKKGKVCWSIHCRQKVGLTSPKCDTCGYTFCSDCLEIWRSGYKGCPHCVVAQAEAAESSGNTIDIKKPYKPPGQRILEKYEKMQRKMERKKGGNEDE